MTLSQHTKQLKDLNKEKEDLEIRLHFVRERIKLVEKSIEELEFNNDR